MARILSDYFIEVGCGCYIIPELFRFLVLKQLFKDLVLKNEFFKLSWMILKDFGSLNDLNYFRFLVL